MEVYQKKIIIFFRTENIFILKRLFNFPPFEKHTHGALDDDHGATKLKSPELPPIQCHPQKPSGAPSA